VQWLERGINWAEHKVAEAELRVAAIRAKQATARYGLSINSYETLYEGDDNNPGILSCLSFLITGGSCLPAGRIGLSGATLKFYDATTDLVVLTLSTDASGYATACLFDGGLYYLQVTASGHSGYLSPELSWPWGSREMTVPLSYPTCADCWPECTAGGLDLAQYTLTDWSSAGLMGYDCSSVNALRGAIPLGFTEDCSGMTAAGSPYAINYRMQPDWPATGRFHVDNTGVVSAVTLLDGGDGYAAAPWVTGSPVLNYITGPPPRNPVFSATLTGQVVTAINRLDDGVNLFEGDYSLSIGMPTIAKHPLTISWQFVPCMYNDFTTTTTEGNTKGSLANVFPTPDYRAGINGSGSSITPTNLILNSTTLPFTHREIIGRACLRVKPTTITCGPPFSASYTFAGIALPTVRFYDPILSGGSTTTLATLTAPDPWQGHSKAVTIAGVYI